MPIAGQAREMAARIDEMRPQVAGLLEELGDPELVADGLQDMYSDSDEYRVGMRAPFELTGESST
jgi:hypothetical protein